MSKSAPPPPDYTGAAQATASGNQQTLEQQTWANRPEVNTPWGQQTWEATPTWDPVSGQYLNQWSSNLNLTPEEQQALDAQQQVQTQRSQLAGTLTGNLSDTYSKPMDWSGFTATANAPRVPTYGQNLPGMAGAPTLPTYGQNLPDMGSAPDTPTYGQNLPGMGTAPTQSNFQTDLDYSGVQGLSDPTDVRNRAEQSLYSRATADLDPQWQQQQHELETNLYNKGLREGDAAFDQEVGNFQRSKSNAYENARNDAITGGGAEASRQFGMDLSTRQQGVGEQNTQAQFHNQTATNLFGEQNVLANLSDQQRQQLLNEQLQTGEQSFGQKLQGANFKNASREQLLAEQLQTGAQQYGQELQGANFNNAERQQLLNEQLQTGDQKFNQQMQSANYTNTLRQQQIAEALQQRNQQLNESNAIMNGQQVATPGMPGFSQAGKSSGADYLGAATQGYNSALQGFGIEQQNQQGLYSGIGSLAMLALLA